MYYPNIILVEDNNILGLKVKLLLEQNGYSVEKTYSSAEDFINNYLPVSEPRIIILDIKLKGKYTGIDIGYHLKEQKSHDAIIFLTGMFNEEVENHLLKINPACYIKKPYDNSTLLLNLKLVVKQINEENNKTLSIKNGKKVFLFNKKDITFLQSDGNYVYVHTIDKKHIVRGKIDEFQALIDDSDFLRCHNRYLINIQFIKQYSYKKVLIQNSEIPISEKYRPILRSIFKE
jgi:DNA-binding LytR/AlgR family response regulator